MKRIWTHEEILESRQWAERDQLVRFGHVWEDCSVGDCEWKTAIDSDKCYIHTHGLPYESPEQAFNR